MRLYLVKNFGWHVVDDLDRFRPSYLPAQAGCVSSSMYVDDPSELNANRAILSFTPYQVWHIQTHTQGKGKYVFLCELVTRLNETYSSPGRDNPLPRLPSPFFTEPRTSEDAGCSGRYAAERFPGTVFEQILPVHVHVPPDLTASSFLCFILPVLCVVAVMLGKSGWDK
ncbi:predicted protein [Histoplasma capsulatum var. duboisii H88]|uniref:Predicted protein n=1 Tax=Ajellomyces capsulatus (strain H88) TaxID=544711 RepID=F0UJS9_AJEC8|nr:predicted protein [Histoplasma capsulatum var. duboisii H88]